MSAFALRGVKGSPMRSSKPLVISMLLLVACATPTYYDTYLQTHADWSPDFPRTDVDIKETAASLYAPPPRTRGIARTTPLIRELRLFEFQGSRHFEIPAEPILSGAVAPASEAIHVLVVQASCTANDANARYLGDATSWYLFRSNRLEAYDHVRFVELCQIDRKSHPSRRRPAEVDAILGETD